MEHAPLLQPQPLAPLLGVLAQLRVQRLGLAHLFAAGLGAHRHVAARLIPLHDGRDVGAHPVKIAVLAPVFHESRPGLAAPYGLPHVAKRLWRHVGVTHQIVWLSDEFVVAITAGFPKRRIAMRDDALGVGGGHQHGIGREFVFLGRDW